MATQAEVVRLEPGQAVRFPPECARCGAPPVHSYRLRGKSLVARVPLCAACHGRTVKTMVAWVAGAIAAATLGVIVLALLLEVVIPLPEEARARANIGMVVALALLAAGSLFLYLALRRSVALHHRVLGPVYLLEDRHAVVLGVRRPEFAARLRALEADLVTAHPDRAARPASFVAPRLPSYLGSIVGVLWGLGTVGVGFVRFHDARTSEILTLKSVEIVAYGVGGAIGLLVMYVLIGLVLTVGAAGWLRATRNDRAAILGKKG